MLRCRLSLLLFLIYAVAGSVQPLFSLRLKELGFSPVEMSIACAMQALASLLAPLIAGQAADRWWPVERCLAVCGIIASITLWLLAGVTTAWAVCLLSLAFWGVMVPSMTLGATLCFTHLERPDRTYGSVRMWGTVGWVIPGWLLGYWFGNPESLCSLMAWLRPHQPESELPDAFRLGAVIALAVSLYALTLPSTPPRRTAGHRFAIFGALSLLRNRAFAVYFACTLGVCVTIPFITHITPLLLEYLEIPRQRISPTLTLSQSMEIASLAALPVILLRLGIRATMLLGLFSWATVLAVMTFGQPAWLVVSSLTLNGLCMCCFLVVGQVFINSRARGDVRASAQGLFTFVCGVGLLTGNLLVGMVRWLSDGQFPTTFAIAEVIAIVLAVVFFAGFPTDETCSA